MTQDTSRPHIELIPSRPAVRADGPTELLVLVRIVPPEIETATPRPLLNLGLVLDRSGSMSGAKLKAARQAAIYAVQQLAANDRVSVIIYDDEVATIVPSTLAVDKTPMVRALERVQAGNMTALHAGWVEGGMQVSRHLEAERLNRVLLLTDGLANVGETEPDRIGSDVRGLAQRGVSTTTMGVGNDYNEDLLEAMAKSGDGNYYFIEGAGDLERIFAAELQGIMATVGQTVSLGLEPRAGAAVSDVLNELEHNEFGRLLLSNLIVGNPVEVVVKLTVPAIRGEADICCFRLAWNAPNSSERQVIREVLALPAVPSDEWETLPENGRVAEQAALLEVARIRQRAIDALAQGDVDMARSITVTGMAAARASLSPAAAAAECETFEALDADLAAGEVSHARKSAHYQNYRRHHSR